MHQQSFTHYRIAPSTKMKLSKCDCLICTKQGPSRTGGAYLNCKSYNPISVEPHTNICSKMSGHAGSEKIMFTTASGAFFGATVGTIESVWAIPKLGAQLPKLSNQLKHVGTRSLVFAAVGCIFTTGEYVAASIRQKEDPINTGVGGALVGVVPGMIKQSLRVGVGAGVVAGAAMAAASFWQSSQESSFDKYAAARHAERT